MASRKAPPPPRAAPPPPRKQIADEKAYTPPKMSPGFMMAECKNTTVESGNNWHLNKPSTRATAKSKEYNADECESSTEEDDSEIDSSKEIGVENNLMEGWLKKKGKYVSSWKRRWSVLNHEKHFTYYTDDGLKNLKGQTSMETILDWDWDDNTKFSMQTVSRKWCFEADTPQKAQQWIEAILPGAIEEREIRREEELSNTAPPPPPRKRRASNLDIENLIYELSQQNILPGSDDLLLLMKRAKTVLQNDDTLVSVDSPVKIVGPIHGNFRDLKRIFHNGGYPGETKSKYIFLGGYVDRGAHSLECLILLLALKIHFPDRVFLLRGSHEIASVNKRCGFYKECLKKYEDDAIYNRFNKLFCYLPVASLINGCMFCSSGGISAISKMKSLRQIRNISRPYNVPNSGMISDLIWAQPDPHINHYDRSMTGAGCVFGVEAVWKFLEHHNLEMIVRGHEPLQNGYECKAGKMLVSVFSSSNYEGCGNKAGMISVNREGLVDFHVFDAEKDGGKKVKNRRNTIADKSNL